MRNSPARICTALRTSPLKSSRIRCVAILPIAPPKSRRMTRVRPEETAARRQRTGHARGWARRRSQPPARMPRAFTSLFLQHVAGAAFGVEETWLLAGLELAAQVGDEDVDRVGRGHR